MLGGLKTLDSGGRPTLELASAAPTTRDSADQQPTRRVSLPLVVLLALLAGLAAPANAHAHRLEAEYRILPNGRVQVESWFDLTGDSPQGAIVQVFRPGGELLTEGKLDDKGLFSFEPKHSETLRVVVSAGAGHRKELIIPKAEAASGQADSVAPIGDSAAVPDVPFADRSSRISTKDVVAGVGFLLALAAFALSVRNARHLRRINRSR
jgi:nickel transport protein